MIGSELTIKFIADKAYLTEGKAINFSQTNLPEIATAFRAPAYWVIEVLAYIAAEQRLHCKVVSYHVGETEFSFTQRQLADDLNKVITVTFRGIDTSGLFATLKGGGSFTHSTSQPVYRRQVHFAPPEPSVRTMTESFFMPIKNVQFRQGCVSFIKTFKNLKEPFQLTISNPEIVEEFDAVKNYFGNVLGTKKIEVAVEVEITDNLITSVKASSPQISKIDKQLIEQVRLEFVRSTTAKKLPEEINQSLFTMDEYFDTFANENFKPDTFHKSDKDLFEDLLTISNTKHYKHLRFLSSKQAYGTMKLRFIQKPFSFLFLIEGQIHFHIVWETLDTEEATYVWQIVKDIPALKNTLEKFDHKINGIKAGGRLAYISSTEDSFKRIYHDYSDSVDGFLKWKVELENVLT